MPPNHSLALAADHLLHLGGGVTFGIISATTGSSMIADVVEPSQLKTGRRSEEMFFAASAFVGEGDLEASASWPAR